MQITYDRRQVAGHPYCNKAIRPAAVTESIRTDSTRVAPVRPLKALKKPLAAVMTAGVSSANPDDMHRGKTHTPPLDINCHKG